jgi:hypothetical protein
MNRATFLQLACVAPWCLRLPAAGCGNDGGDMRTKATSWLLERQSPDGAWRSDTYGSFRDGRALTPVVLRALPAGDAADKACRWLLENRGTLFDDYPIHLASALLEAATRFPELAPLAKIARDRLLSLQCPGSGGWSYSPRPPADESAPMQQANLSATAMAIDGLRAGGLAADDPRLCKAMAFLRTCQNHAGGDPAFDDGGFFQLAADPARNKAGRAGTDRLGVIRYRSYASATADGLRALLLCGEKSDSPAVRAAADWLRRFADRTPANLKYYTARSIARTASLLPELLPFIPDLAASQQPDGSWRNPAGEMREDCPVVATALALEAK